MDARAIKAFMSLRGEGPKDVTEAINRLYPKDRPEHESDVCRVLAYERPNERIRKKIAKHWNLPYEELWDGDRVAAAS